MLYSLFHVVTDTHMDDNGFPWYIDVVGGIMDLLLLVGFMVFATRVML